MNAIIVPVSPNKSIAIKYAWPRRTCNLFPLGKSITNKPASKPMPPDTICVVNNVENIQNLPKN